MQFASSVIAKATLAGVNQLFRRYLPTNKTKGDIFPFQFVALGVWEPMLGVTPADQASALSGVTDRWGPAHLCRPGP